MWSVASSSVPGPRGFEGLANRPLVTSTHLSLFPSSYTVSQICVKGCSMDDISCTSLSTCQIAADGSAIRLVFEAANGQPTSLTLPIRCIQQLLMTLPHAASKAIRAKHRDETLRLVFPLGDWKLEQAAGASEVILTLNTTDGFEVSFSIGHDTIAEMSRTARSSADVSAPDQPYLN